MFLGHYAVGFGSKRAAPKTSLGTLILAAQFLDLLWPILVLTGVEHLRIDPGNTAVTPADFYDYPISHSLLTVLAWGAAFGLLYAAIQKYRRGGWVVAIAVVSHWVLDVLSHRPDMPLAPGLSTYVGFGLWYSVPATIAVETVLFAAGVYLYTRATIAKDKTGRYAFWSLVAFLAVIYALNLASPPPPSDRAVAWGALLAWLFVPWGYWIDRHRLPRIA
jgi:hypothetical protein